MIKDPQKLTKFENYIKIKDGRFPFEYSISIFEALWEEGVRLGVLPLKNSLEGIDVDIKIAKILNSCLKNYSQK